MTPVAKLTQLAAAVICLAAAIALVSDAGLPQRAEYSGYQTAGGLYAAPEAGSAAPSFTLRTLSQELFSLDSVKAEATIISFWATWCPPCRFELLELQKLHDWFQAPLQIVAINLGEPEATVRDWVDELGLTFAVLVDPAQSAARRYQVPGAPATFLLDADRRIRQVYFGPVSQGRVEGALAQLVRPA